MEPEFLPWDGRRVPVTFLAGYLGSGKTTLINSVLATTDRPVAVFVNDVGSVNVDARLIRRLSGDTLELTVEMGRLSARAGKGSGTATLDGELAVSCDLMFVIVDAEGAG